MNTREELLNAITAFLEMLNPLGADFTFDIFTNIYNAFIAYIKRLYDFATSGMFPNVNLSSYDQKLYYIRNGLATHLPGSGWFWRAIPNQPNVIFKNSLFQYHQGHGLYNNIKARQITNNVVGGKTGMFRLGVKGYGGAFMGYKGAVRLNPIKRNSPVEWWTGSTFTPLDIIDMGALRLINRQVVVYGLDAETGKKSWQGINLPREANDLHAASTLPVEERNVQSNAAGTGLEVFKAGTWQPLWNF